MKKILLMTVMVVLAASCHIERLSAYQEGFKHPGYVLYLGATESGKLEFVDPALLNDPALSMTSSNESVVSFNGNEMIVKGAGEALVTAAYSAYQSFTVGVKVIDPKRENDLYVRMETDESVSDGDQGVILAKYNQGIGISRYALLYKSSGTNAATNMYDTYGDGEVVFFCKSNTSEWPKGAILTFNANPADGSYKLVNENAYLQPNMKFGSDGDEAKATVVIDEDNYLKVQYAFGSWKNATETFIIFNGQNFKYDTMGRNILPVELYILKTVKFDAPTADVVEVYVDGSVKYESSNGNIQLGDGDHSLTFKVPDGVKLYYKFVHTGSRSVSPAADDQEWIPYVAGSEIPVTNASGAVEYYAESHGLQSEHIVKTFTVTTGVSMPDYNNENMEEPIYYNLNGCRISTTDLAPGIYIKKTGFKIEKVLK